MKMVHPVLAPAARYYFSKPRPYSFDDVRVMVHTRVFHPHLTISTKLMLEFLRDRKPAGKKVLELGSGCGVVSVCAARWGADVTATDINPAAVANTKSNAEANGEAVNCLQSDLFDAIPNEHFDLIIINPPYFAKEPTDDAEKAWFCGEDFQYFRRLFPQINDHLTKDGKVWMILSGDCELDKISDLCKSAGLTWNQICSERKWGEWHYIFEIKPL